MNRQNLFLWTLLPLLFLLVAAAPFSGSRRSARSLAPVTPQMCPSPVLRLGVIGDYGEAGPDEADVAALVNSWSVDYVTTTGDNNYPDGQASTIDKNIGQYYHQYIFPYVGSYGSGASVNRFFPSLGNHDWHTPNAQPYLDYFTLPGNERYYEKDLGPVRLFIVDSDSSEPDGNTTGSTQANWLQVAMTASTTDWNLVVMHHAPYSSGSAHGSQSGMQWPYADWGATAVLAGHDHDYERIHRDGILYFVNGLGGRSLRPFGTPISGSAVRYSDDYGAMLIEAEATCINFRFYARDGTLIDSATEYQPNFFNTFNYLPIQLK